MITDEIPVEETFLAVRHCRLTKVYDKTKMRLTFVLFQAPFSAWIEDRIMSAEVDKENAVLQQHLPGLFMLRNSCVRTLFRKALVEVGARHLTGRAPAGAMERELQQYLEQLMI